MEDKINYYLTNLSIIYFCYHDPSGINFVTEGSGSQQCWLGAWLRYFFWFAFC